MQPDRVLVEMYLNDAQTAGRFYVRSIPPPFSRRRFRTWAANRFQILGKTFFREGGVKIDPKWRERFRAGRDLKRDRAPSHAPRSAPDPLLLRCGRVGTDPPRESALSGHRGEPLHDGFGREVFVRLVVQGDPPKKQRHGGVTGSAGNHR